MKLFSLVDECARLELVSSFLSNWRYYTKLAYGMNNPTTRSDKGVLTLAQNPFIYLPNCLKFGQIKAHSLIAIIMNSTLCYYFKLTLDYCYFSYSQHVHIMAHVALRLLDSLATHYQWYYGSTIALFTLLVCYIPYPLDLSVSTQHTRKPINSLDTTCSKI